MRGNPWMPVAALVAALALIVAGSALLYAALLPYWY